MTRDGLAWCALATLMASSYVAAHSAAAAAALPALDTSSFALLELTAAARRSTSSAQTLAATRLAFLAAQQALRAFPSPPSHSDSGNAAAAAFSSAAAQASVKRDVAQIAQISEELRNADTLSEVKIEALFRQRSALVKYKKNEKERGSILFFFFIYKYKFFCSIGGPLNDEQYWRHCRGFVRKLRRYVARARRASHAHCRSARART